MMLLFAYRFVPKHARTRDIKFLFLCLGATGLAYGINMGFKDVFAVPRPCAGLALCPTDFSFPSSHSTIAFAAAGVLGYLSTHAVLILAAILAVSRVVEGVHTWPDILVGSVIGLLVANLVYLLFRQEFVEAEHADTQRQARDSRPGRR